MLKMYLALLSLALLAQVNCENVPAIVFGDKTLSFFPTLQHVTGDEFTSMIQSQVDHDTMTVVFVEQNLSVEDFSQCRLNTKTCFEHLSKTDKSYLSSVEHPVDSLLNAFGKKKSVHVDNNDIDSIEMSLVDGEKILFVYLEHADRPEDFSKHDELMNKVLKQLKGKYEEVLAIYTAAGPSFKYSKPLKRHVREAADVKTNEEPKSAEPAQKPKQTEGEEDGFKVHEDPHVLIALKEIQVLKVGNKEPKVYLSKDLTLKVNKGNDTDSGFTAVLSGSEFKLEMMTSISAGTWKVHFRVNDNDESREKYHPRTAVLGFGERYSFGCGFLYLETYDNVVTLVGFQYQPTFNPSAEGGNGEGRKFSNYVNDCVGYFSPGILSALFVVILLVSIMTYGISMMLDIKTMDKFDDPKGKTITVSAQE